MINKRLKNGQKRQRTTTNDNMNSKERQYKRHKRQNKLQIKIFKCLKYEINCNFIERVIMRQSIDNCVQSMRSDRNVISAERQQLVEELHAPEKKFSTKTRHSSRMTCDRLTLSRCIRTHVSTAATITFSLSYWANMRGPLKSKSGSETANAIAEIIRKSGKHSKNLQTNMEKKFYNADMQRLVKKHSINHDST